MPEFAVLRLSDCHSEEGTLPSVQTSLFCKVCQQMQNNTSMSVNVFSIMPKIMTFYWAKYFLVKGQVVPVRTMKA